ncbi:alcohol dehydrogenase (NADP+) [Colletotrichum paranaense]|uniref:Alcohol dehydrogenase (NADP+) n=1 Tax=Colletotrichum paranaense TaxID=1914294 RepID=A0ABQ9SCJ9_9PEZI|nr:alcohol dehydrogenase (NADP+) [Colletotrichum paranaense]KAK1533131.1 alcohol dehydrogenase (NADP+) [Colletotrichum paranaense]
MGYPDNFEGFVIDSQSEWTKFRKAAFNPQPFQDRDVDIAVEACGVCGSDVHKISGGWGPCSLPLCVGHEVVGRVVRKGPEASTVDIGDRVGVGAQVSACLDCRNCLSDNENYCPHQIDTYDSPYPDGTMSQGGYAGHIRVHEYFVFKIPENLESSAVAPMLCAGITTYSPLVRANVGPGKKVGVIGIGGLGHFGIMWAKALGAEAYAISHSPHKAKDALALGAKDFISTSAQNWHEPWKYTFDFILNTADATDTFDLKTYMSTLAVNGVFHNVGLPDKPLPTLTVFDYMPGGYSMAASHIGSRPEMLAMLKLASEQNIKSWAQEINIGESGCKEAVEMVDQGKTRYRAVLVGYDNVFGKRY